jgi:glycosyltransferase involved in cell wall biosynthesis
MSTYQTLGINGATPSVYELESRRLEIVTTCVGFDDMLDLTLGLNHAHADHFIVVTSHEDRATQQVCLKHSATCVQTDLFKKNGRSFNKGAAINAGFDYFQFHGWRLHLDCDIALPDKFNQTLFNHSHLEMDCLYGAYRVDVVGKKGIEALLNARVKYPQHAYLSGVSPVHGGAVFSGSPSASSARYVDKLRGYCPIGFFQLWHASQQRPYPYSLGTAAHDDVMFAASWPESKRRLLPSVFTYHVCATPPYYGQNWDGRRRMGRIDGEGR